MKYTDKLSKDGVVFSDRPDSVPYNYRISYKIAVICLIMARACGKRGCSLIKMHILSGALMDQLICDKVIQFISGKKDVDFYIRFDPAVNRAIEYARSEEIIFQQANGLYRLSDLGRQLADLICKDELLLKKEKEVIDKISQKMSEEIIQEISKKWRTVDA